MYLGANCISWAAKKQPTVARSSTETEYRAFATTTAELTWICYILRDISLYLKRPPLLFCDNMSALHLTVNPVIHAWTKHIEIDYHFVREKVVIGALVTRFVSSVDQLADVFTKPLTKDVFYRLRDKLNVGPPPPLSLRGSDKGSGPTQTQVRTNIDPDQIQPDNAQSNGCSVKCKQVEQPP